MPLINRPALLVAYCAATHFASAQIDINTIVQQRNAGQGTAVVQADQEPFAPNLFVGSFTLEMHLYKGSDEQKHSPVLTTVTNSAEKTLLVTRTPGAKQDVHLLIDLKEKWQYMLMDDGQGGRTAMKTRPMKVNVADAEREAGDVQVTDETRTIDGHLCTKVISKSKDGTWTGWLAKDMKTPFADVMRNLQGKGRNDRSQELAGIHGFPLEYEWVATDGKERIVCHIRDLREGSPDEQVFSLEGYQIMELPAMPGMGR